MGLTLLAPTAAAEFAEGDRPGGQDIICYLSAEASWHEYFWGGEYEARGGHAAWIYAPSTPACLADGTLQVKNSANGLVTTVDTCSIPDGTRNNCDTGGYDKFRTTVCYHARALTATVYEPEDPVKTGWGANPVC